MKNIPLTSGGFTIVDDDDFVIYSKWHWAVNNNGYVRRTLTIKHAGKKTKYKTLYLHRLIINCPTGHEFEIDHINRDKLDNRKSNLRLTSSSLNKYNSGIFKNNTSGVRGVREVSKNHWMARIGYKYLGTFGTKEEANEAYQNALRAKLNR